MSLRKAAIKRISVTQTKHGRTLRVPIQLYIKKPNGFTAYKELKGSSIIFDLESPDYVEAAVKSIRKALLDIKIEGEKDATRTDRPAKVAGRA